MTSPFISIILPLYNKEKFVYETLLSAITQTYSRYEIIVVNDGSTDKSEEVIKPLMDKIRYKSILNGGPGAARNVGIEMAKGEYIAFLDADDLWLPNKLELQVKAVTQYPEIAMVVTNHEGVGGSVGVPQWRLPNDCEWLIVPKESSFHMFLKGFVICTPSVMVSTEIIRKVGGFPTDVRRGEDVYTWFKIGMEFPVAYGRDVCVKVRMDEEGITMTTGFENHETNLLFDRLRDLALQSGKTQAYRDWQNMLFRSVFSYTKRSIHANRPECGWQYLQEKKCYLNWWKYLGLYMILCLSPVIRSLKGLKHWKKTWFDPL
jgi:glycosyltransferase involved in cell wall biosynthesis